jgi:hypothetical protein
MGVFHTSVAGVTMKNDDGMERQKLILAAAKVGQAVELIREPDNEHDDNAVAVWIESTVLLVAKVRGKIGYIPADLAWEIAEHMDDGGKIRATISELTGGTADKPTRGVVLELEKV